MAYIPKNRIQSNLYTAGGEYYIPGSDPDYIGYYHKLYTGKTFTGKTPSDKPNLVLLPIKIYDAPEESNPTKVEILNNPNNLIYSDLKNIDSSILVYPPQLEFPQPTEDNYKSGEFQRFFCKKRNEFSYLEISQDSYNKLIQQDPTIYFLNWEPFNIPWTLTGERKKVFNTNRNVVLLEEKNKKFFGFSNYLQKEYLKYYLTTKIEENLETDGTEFENQRTGKPYIGKYHIHPEKGPMVGAKHIKEYHDYLVPIRQISNEVLPNNKTYSPKIQTNTRSSSGY